MQTLVPLRTIPSGQKHVAPNGVCRHVWLHPPLYSPLQLSSSKTWAIHYINYFGHGLSRDKCLSIYAGNTHCKRGFRRVLRDNLLFRRKLWYDRCRHADHQDTPTHCIYTQMAVALKQNISPQYSVICETPVTFQIFLASRDWKCVLYPIVIFLATNWESTKGWTALNSRLLLLLMLHKLQLYSLW